MIWKAPGGRVLFINKFAVNLRLPWFLLVRQNVDLRRMNTLLCSCYGSYDPTIATQMNDAEKSTDASFQTFSLLLQVAVVKS